MAASTAAIGGQRDATRCATIPIGAKVAVKSVVVVREAYRVIQELDIVMGDVSLAT
ncbi:hypothetical protein DPMN_107288 [Dreissena polymorpha]|uniref:Uncharacterized protein n=1 Tax=Dreissena polymorpha TaxID=45954 RepID=A0A9D4QKS5_DREPO|nr:hypothetical protein DPMN_107288 [Dreissena polymorpha]